MSILVLGDANADLAAPLRAFPREGDDAALLDLAWGSGGAGVNVVTALALSAVLPAVADWSLSLEAVHGALAVGLSTLSLPFLLASR